MVKRGVIVFALCLLSLNIARAAELTATVDRHEAALDEHVVLTLSLINSDTRLRAQGVSPNIDLSVLSKDFDVGTPKVENNYNIFRGRGRSTSKLSVDLFPRHSGKLTIPAFHVDDLSTQAIVIKAHALAPGAMPEVFSRGGVSASHVWQRQQVVAWLDVYHRVQLKTASIGEYISTEPMAIELLEHQDLAQNERKETVKGVSYDVTRIAWAIFPKQAGTLTIYLPDVWAVTKDGRKLRLPHQQQQVTVKTLPATVGDDIPVGKPSLTQSTPSPAPTANNISSWTVTVRGPFSRFALPDILPLPPLPPGIKIYGDHGQRNTEAPTTGLTTEVNYTLSALPKSGGDFSLPPVRIPYFDPLRGVLDVVELPGQDLVVPAATANDVPPTATTNNHSIATPENAEDAAMPWKIVATVFALLWFATLFLLWRRPQIQVAPTAASAPTPHSPPADHHHPLQAQLLKAFASRTLEQGLSDWERRHGAHSTLRHTVRAVQQVCYGQGRDADNAALHAAVTEAVTIIRNGTPSKTDAANDPWRPEAFAVDTINQER